ncbi:ATP-binding cassette domain-containing protein [Streptomyces sp. NPDC047973]|uniref:ABC transporter ATP-binding protein/permease n=1 Tax=Streptomyces sp. NPDC047973 TaxID=3155383 RepID=UPI0034323BEF
MTFLTVNAPRREGRGTARTVRRLGDVLVLLLWGVPVLVAIAGPFVAGSTASVAAPYLPAGSHHPLGTDALGRDVLALALRGGRTVVAASAGALCVAYLLAVPVGLLAAGARHRITDEALMRAVDALLALPGLLLLMTLAAAGHGDVPTLIAAVAVLQLPAAARLVRSAALAPGCRTTMEALRLQGAPWWMRQRYVLRCVAGPVVTDGGSRFVLVLGLLASANFLGLGLPSDSADWAVLVERNTDALFLQPAAVLTPAVLLTVLCVGVNLGLDRVLGRSRARDVPAPTDRASATAPATSGPVPSDTLLTCRNLSVRTDTGTELIGGVDLTLRRGQVLAVVGPSGSGKTALGLAALGLTEPGLSVGGSVLWMDRELLGLPERERRALRAGKAAHLPQDPASVLDPVRTVGATLREVARAAVGRSASRADVERAAAAALEAAGLDDARHLLRRRPHQLSGGQQQRMALATALAARPHLIVLDEPTSALDAHTTRRLRERLRGLAEDGTALLVITHDLMFAAELADDVLVMDGGRAVSAAPSDLAAGDPAPQHVPSPPSKPRAAAMRARVEARATAVHLPGRRRALLEPVSLSFPVGSRTLLLGPSGAGKSTLARALTGLVPAQGTVLHAGRALPARLADRARDELRAVQYVHQNSRASFDGRRAVLAQIAETAQRLRGLPRTDAMREALALGEVLELPECVLRRRPAALSGGQLQRAALIRAMGARPDLLITDEATAALDAAAARRVRQLLADVTERDGTAVLFISHDRGPARVWADRVLVVENGRLRPEGDPEVW